MAVAHCVVLLQNAAQALRSRNFTEAQQALHSLYVLFHHHIPFRDEDPISTSASSLGIELVKNLLATDSTTNPLLESSLPAIDFVIYLCYLPGVLPAKHVSTRFHAKLFNLRSKMQDLYTAPHVLHQKSPSSVTLEFLFTHCIACSFLNTFPLLQAIVVVKDQMFKPELEEDSRSMLISFLFVTFMNIHSIFPCRFCFWHRSLSGMLYSRMEVPMSSIS